MPRTDTAIRTVKPGAKPAKLFDERGLFLIVTPAGARISASQSLSRSNAVRQLKVL